MLPVATAEYAGAEMARQLGLPLWFWRNLLVVATGWMVVGVSGDGGGRLVSIGLVIPGTSQRLRGLTDSPGFTSSRPRVGRGYRPVIG